MRDTTKASLAELLSIQLQGKPGLDGRPGRPGAPGLDGKDGLNGKDGRDGLNGRDGIDGKHGLNGKPGRHGLNGKDGRDGIDGKDGRDGINGKDGRDGKDGKDGINWRGAWSESADYKTGDAVQFAGSSFVATKRNRNAAPGRQDSPWDLMALRGATGASGSSGTGSGAARWGTIDGDLGDQADLQAALDAKADSAHGHAISDTTGLQAALDAKADSAHGHAISDTTGLQAALDAKVDDSQVSAFGLTLLDDANAATARATIGLNTATIDVTINGGGSAISTGIKGEYTVPFACTITGVTALADDIGSIVVDVWRSTYAAYPPVDGGSLTASAPITLSSAAKAQDTTLAGWTTSLAAGDVLRFNVDSAATITRLFIQIAVTR